jgi:hypothetical protein
MLKQGMKPEKETEVKFIKKVAPATAAAQPAGKAQAARTEPKQFGQPCAPMRGD